MKKAVKRGLTQRLRERVGMGDSSDEDETGKEAEGQGEVVDTDGETTLKGDGILEKYVANGVNGNEGRRHVRGRDKGVGRTRGRTKSRHDVEMGYMRDERGRQRQVQQENENRKEKDEKDGKEIKNYRHGFQLAVPGLGLGMSLKSMSAAGGLEQSMPADAVLAKEGAEEV